MPIYLIFGYVDTTIGNHGKMNAALENKNKTRNGTTRNTENTIGEIAGLCSRHKKTNVQGVSNISA